MALHIKHRSSKVLAHAQISMVTRVKRRGDIVWQSLGTLRLWTSHRQIIYSILWADYIYECMSSNSQNSRLTPICEYRLNLTVLILA